MEKEINIEYNSLIFCDKPNNVEEFSDIIQNLINGDLAVLYQVLMVEETEQIKLLRKLRDKITYYPNLYNAYTARVLLDDPVIIIKNEMVARFLNLY
jgi:hypothetical protein